MGGRLRGGLAVPFAAPCCIMQCIVVLYSAVQCCAVLCLAVPCLAVPHCAVLCRAVPNHAVSCCVVPACRLSSRPASNPSGAESALRLQSGRPSDGAGLSAGRHGRRAVPVVSGGPAPAAQRGSTERRAGRPHAMLLSWL